MGGERTHPSKGLHPVLYSIVFMALDGPIQKRSLKGWIEEKLWELYVLTSVVIPPNRYQAYISYKTDINHNKGILKSILSTINL